MSFESKHARNERLLRESSDSNRITTLETQVHGAQAEIATMSANTHHIDPRTITAGDINTHTLKIGETTIETEEALSCPIHGNDAGLTITADTNKTTPKMKLVVCRFCMLEKMAQGL